MAELDQAAPALRVEQLKVSFGGVVAVAGISFDVPAGQLLGVIGANGAGKTTMFDAVCGMVPHSGRVVVSGRDVGHLSPTLRARAGLGRSFQDARLFPALSVRDCLAMALQHDLDDPGMAAELLSWPTARRGDRSLRARADQAIADFGLEPWADSFVSDLSTGTRRIVDLACVCALHPAVILLDEPASGIAQREVEALAEVIVRLRDRAGATVLVVEHDVPLVRRIAERVLVMASGRLIADGTPEAVLELPEVIASYLGTDEGALRRSGATLPAAAGALVAVQDEDGSNEGTPEAVPVPGLPERDSFRIPLRATGGAGLAAAAAVLLAAVLQTASPQPLARPAAGRQQAPLAAAPATSAPSPARTTPAPAIAALPPVAPLATQHPLPPLDQGFFFDDVIVPPPPPRRPPPPTAIPPTPTPCPVDQLAPVCDILDSLPLPVPLTPPLAAGMAWARAADGPWAQLPTGWRVAAWGASSGAAPAAQQGTLIAWTGSGAGDPALGEVVVSWWASPARLGDATVQGPLLLPGGQRQWSQMLCDGSRCVLVLALSGAAGVVDAHQVEVTAASLR
jgi:ABC-type branched-subunit amino acid transport system ATPase component